MTSRHLFDVTVRGVGIVVLVYGLWDLINCALLLTDYWRNESTTTRFHYIYGWLSIGIGLFLTRGAGVLVNFANGVKKENEMGTENVHADEHGNEK